MGATPASALALAVLPFGPSASQENELTDLLTGVTDLLTGVTDLLTGVTDLLTGVGRFVCLWRVTVFYWHHLQAALFCVSSIAI
jgi:hypothetical protein